MTTSILERARGLLRTRPVLQQLGEDHPDFAEVLEMTLLCYARAQGKHSELWQAYINDPGVRRWLGLNQEAVP